MSWIDCKMKLVDSPYHVETQTMSQFNGLNATNKYNAICFFSETNEPITHVGLSFLDYLGATQPFFETGLVDFDSSGRPNTTFLGGGSPAKVTWQYQIPSWGNSHQILTLDNPYTPTFNQPLAILTKWSSGTISSVARPQPWAYVYNQMYQKHYYDGLPVFRHYDGSSWTLGGPYFPIFSYQTASRAFGLPWAGYTTSVSTSGHRLTLKFKLPVGHPRIKIGHLLWFGAIAGTTVKGGIWDAAGTELQSSQFDPDVIDTGSAAATCLFPCGDSPIPLEPDTTYYVGVQATGSTCSMTYWDVKHTALRSCILGNIDGCLSQWNGSAWSDSNTWVPLINPRVTSIEASSGGGSAPPSMHGGFSN